MTRGNLIVIKNNEVYISNQFNGDMYPEGHGAEVYELLKRVESVNDFIKVVSIFNEFCFGYDDYGIHTVPDLDFTLDYFKQFGSDYLYVKNLDGTEYMIQDRNTGKPVGIAPGKILVWYFGSLVSHPNFEESEKRDLPRMLAELDGKPQSPVNAMSDRELFAFVAGRIKKEIDGARAAGVSRRVLEEMAARDRIVF